MHVVNTCKILKSYKNRCAAIAVYTAHYDQIKVLVNKIGASILLIYCKYLACITLKRATIA